jgi:hypothetical protein
LPPARRRFFASPSANFWRQGWKRSAVFASTASHNSCSVDLQSSTTEMSMLRANKPICSGFDVDAPDFGSGTEARRRLDRKTARSKVGCRLIMPTIAEVDGTRIMMFPFDHDPPHIRAFGADFRAKLAISDARVLDLRSHRTGNNAALTAMGTPTSRAAQSTLDGCKARQPDQQNR